jgi:HKD family nuclease
VTGNLFARKRELRAASLCAKMAELDFILQAVTAANHAKALQALLALPDLTEVLISVAFVREPGLDAVEAVIKPVATKAKVFIGIRNDITSIQAVQRLLAMKVKLYAVDTGSRKIIFHPKLYLAASVSKASVIIGSANMTFGGLHNNIEVSTRVDLDLTNASDKKFHDDVSNAFVEMLKKHPQHVFLIIDDQHADKLFQSGRLADENLIPAPSTTSRVKNNERDDVPHMKLNYTAPPRKKTSVIKTDTPLGLTTPKTPAIAPIPATSLASLLVWESKPLTRRDLDIPTAKNTHRTYSMLFNQGIFRHIDQRSYFRNHVFAQLNWTKDSLPKTAHYERASADFELVIKNISYGRFNLKLSHNTKTDTKSYKDKNSMTQIYWGNASSHIRRDDLLKHTLYLYRKDTTPPEFTIEID